MTETDEPRTVVVIVPDDLGDLVVCDLAQLVDNLNEGISLDAAVLDAGIDTLNPRSSGLHESLQRVRALNDTGDAGAYWRRSDD